MSLNDKICEFPSLRLRKKSEEGGGGVCVCFYIIYSKSHQQRIERVKALYMYVVLHVYRFNSLAWHHHHNNLSCAILGVLRGFEKCTDTCNRHYGCRYVQVTCNRGVHVCLDKRTLGFFLCCSRLTLNFTLLLLME